MSKHGVIKMTDQIAKQFDVDVNNETYVVTRVLEERNEKIETYGFTTVVDGQEYKLGAILTSETISDLEAQLGLRVSKELTDILLTEFQIEIAKLKEINHVRT